MLDKHQTVDQIDSADAVLWTEHDNRFPRGNAATHMTIMGKIMTLCRASKPKLLLPIPRRDKFRKTRDNTNTRYGFDVAVIRTPSTCLRWQMRSTNSAIPSADVNPAETPLISQGNGRMSKRGANAILRIRLSPGSKPARNPHLIAPTLLFWKLPRPCC